MDLLLLNVSASDLGQMGEMARTFHISWPAFISQLVSFLLVAFLLRIYAFKPVLEILECRRCRIAEGEEKLKRSEEKLANAKTEADNVLSRANDDAQRIIDEARQGVKQLTEQKMKETQLIAEQLLERSRSMAEIEKEKYSQELRQEFGSLIATSLKTLVSKNLASEDYAKLNEEALNFINEGKQTKIS